MKVFDNPTCRPFCYRVTVLAHQNDGDLTKVYVVADSVSGAAGIVRLLKPARIVTVEEMGACVGCDI